MKFLSYEVDGKARLAVQDGEDLFGSGPDDTSAPTDLLDLIRKGPQALAAAAERLRKGGQHLERDSLKLLPPFVPGKVICVGLNYADHARESKMAIPETPTLFSRFTSSIIADGAPIRVPKVSSALDFEGELVAVIGKRGRYIAKDAALDHVAGYSIFNDGSIRDYQLRTPQWTIGKNFDDSGPFGPVFVTADALPTGATGLAIETRLNGEVMQKSSTDQLIFDVSALVAVISEAMTLEPGDLIVTGTPAGVGAARTPKVFMKAGDICEVEIEQIGLLRNPVANDE